MSMPKLRLEPDDLKDRIGGMDVEPPGDVLGALAALVALAADAGGL